MPTEVTLKLAKDHGRQEIFLSLARVANSSRLLLGASDGKVYDVDPLAEKPEWKALEGHGPYVAGVAIAGDVLVSGGYDCKLLWRKLDGGEVLHTAENAHARWIRKLVASPSGQIIASVADDMVCRLWDPAGKLVHELKGHDERTPHHFPSMLFTCAFSPDGQRLATADKTGRICLWDVAAGSKLLQLEAAGLYTWDPKQRIHSIGGTRSLAFSPDGQTLVAGGIGKIGNIDHLDGPSRVEVFDLAEGKNVHVFEGEAKGLVEQLYFQTENKWLVGLGGDNGGFVQFYDLAEKKVTKSDKAPMHVHAAALSEDGTKLYAAGHGKVAVWEIA
jgi:WD40 repeat protein